MSGLSRTPGKRVWVNSPPRVRIPLPPPGPLCGTPSVVSRLYTTSSHHSIVRRLTGVGVREVDSTELWLLVATAVIATLFFIGMLMPGGVVPA
jgi:hypothetical protein